MKTVPVENLIETLATDKEICDIVKKSKLVDLATELSKKLDISPESSSKLTIGLVKRIKEMALANKNKNIKDGDMDNYFTRANTTTSPIPPKDDDTRKVIFKSFTKVRDNKEEDGKEKLDEKGMVPAMPAGKNNDSPRWPFKRSEFPPDPKSEPEDWPYDQLTIIAQDPKSKSQKRPLMAGKNPFHTYTRRKSRWWTR
jgi:hypothetical protein